MHPVPAAKGKPRVRLGSSGPAPAPPWPRAIPSSQHLREAGAPIMSQMGKAQGQVPSWAAPHCVCSGADGARPRAGRP